MPELPEVETIRRDLTQHIIGRPVKSVSIVDGTCVRQGRLDIRSGLIGRAFAAVDRKGKMLIFSLAKSDFSLLVHLRMTGQFIFRDGASMIAGGHSLSGGGEIDWAQLPGKHTRMWLEFSGQARLFFNDVRRFGEMFFVTEPDKEKILSRFGPDVFDGQFTLDIFTRAVARSSASIKSLLLNQTLLSGIGNIYADEICFAARIHPQTPARDLSVQQLQALYRSTVRVIRRSVELRGTTFRDYMDLSGRRGNFFDSLQVYGRGGRDCRRCRQAVVATIKVAGRTTAFCPFCQKI